jgi:hypothetical protein
LCMLFCSERRALCTSLWLPAYAFLICIWFLLNWVFV